MGNHDNDNEGQPVTNKSVPATVLPPNIAEPKPSTEELEMRELLRKEGSTEQQINVAIAQLQILVEL